MNCADYEILICDYVDGGLAPAQKAGLERHLAECPACAEVARDCAAAVAFMGRAEAVEPPQELITRILFEGPWNAGKAKPAVWRKWLSAASIPILQPKFAMGMAMTILSLAMLWRTVGPWNAGKAKPAVWRKWLSAASIPILQPKFAMGMAMTILSLAMLWRTVG